MTVIRGKRTTFLLLALICSASGISLPEKYDQIRPNNGGIGDVVNVSMNILAIRDVDEDEQNITVDLLLRTFWGDKRLANIVDAETVFVDKIPQVWIPHLSIANSAESKYSEQSLKLKSDGTLEYTQRISAKLNCPISSVKYPFGRQTCQIQLNSNGYTTIHLQLIWHGIISSEDIPTYGPEYKLSSIDQSSKRQKTESGEFSYIYVDITITRCPLRILTHAILPTLFFAILSFYITFFMGFNEHKDNMKSNSEEEDPEDKHDMSASFRTKSKIYFDIIHVSINTFLLLLVVIVGQINFLKSPRSAAITGLDVWIWMVGTVVFVCFMLSLTNCFNETNKMEIVTKKVRNVLRVAIPLVFSVFLVVYFAFYLS